MADLIIETGEGVPGAESYVTVAEADAYHRKMGNAAWPAAPVGDEDRELAAKEAALRRSALFLDAYALPRLTAAGGGEKKRHDQALLFPRTGAVDFSGAPLDRDSVPDAYKNAQCEAALLAFTGVRLTPEAEAGPLLKRKKIDVLEKEWFEGSYGAKPVFGWLDSLLSGLFGPAAGHCGLRVAPIARG